MNKLLRLNALSLALALAACGGGGGGVGGGSTNLTVDGTASKGLLSGALVQAYVYDSSNAKSPLGESVKTDASGKYTLSLPPSAKPVVIEITSTSGTKMLDETLIDTASGGFQSVDAPSSLVIRTGVSSLTANATVHANVYTEAAVNAALTAKDSSGNAVALSSSVFDAAKGAIRATLPTGVNPFTTRGVNANDANPTDSEKALTTLSAGVVQSGKDTAGSCSADATGMTCAISRINNASKIKVDSSNKATFADAAEQMTVNQRVIDKAKTVNNTFVNTVKATLPNAVQMTDAIDPVVIAAQDSLSTFIKSMRDGFKLTETTIKTAADDFTQRTKTLNAVADYSGNDFATAFKGCKTNDSSIVCSNTSGPSAVTYVANSTGEYGYQFNSVLNGRNFKTSGTIVWIYDQANNSVEIAVDAKRILVNVENITQKKVSDSTLKVSLLLHPSGNESSCIDCAGTINLTAKLYDNNDQSKYVAVNINNGSAIFSIASKTITNVTLSGDLDLNSSGGDKLSGSLIATGQRVNGTASQQVQLTSIKFSFSGKLGNTEIITGIMSLNRDYSSYEPSLNYSLTNLPKDNVETTLTLVGGTVIRSTQTPSATELNKRSVNLRITAGSTNFVTLVQNQQFIERMITWYPLGSSSAPSSFPAGWYWDLVPGSKTIITSSSGDFTAQLDLTNSFSGPLMQGSTQIGEIINNVIYVNGQEISLY
ncbi:MAG: hypothetical protein QE283_14400 [Rhodoferax sp.]|nr:hypothetical protein [Rhodoferax sp.]